MGVQAILAIIEQLFSIALPAAEQVASEVESAGKDNSAHQTQVQHIQSAVHHVAAAKAAVPASGAASPATATPEPASSNG